MKDSKSNLPYERMTSEVHEGRLVLALYAIRVEETIRFAYSLHISLLSVVHDIIVQKKGEVLASFSVNTPNHGE